MQTLETTRALSQVDRELIVKTLNLLYARRAVGDIDGMLNLIAPEIVCFPKTTWRHARYPRRIVGKEAVREAFLQRHINYVYVDSVEHRLLIDGDQTAAHRTTTICERGSSVTYTFDSIDLIRFRDGLIIEICELPDGSAYDAVINYPH